MKHPALLSVVIAALLLTPVAYTQTVKQLEKQEKERKKAQAKRDLADIVLAPAETVRKTLIYQVMQSGWGVDSQSEQHLTVSRDVSMKILFTPVSRRVTMSLTFIERSLNETLLSVSRYELQYEDVMSNPVTMRTKSLMKDKNLRAEVRDFLDLVKQKSEQQLAQKVHP